MSFGSLGGDDVEFVADVLWVDWGRPSRVPRFLAALMPAVTRSWMSFFVFGKGGEYAEHESAGGGVGEDVTGVDSGGGEGVVLEGEVLVGGGYAGVAE